MSAPIVALVVARGRNGVIGRDGDLPWRLRSDLQRFKAVTMGKPCLMGRKTWESFPAQYRPLPGRTNIVVSRRQTSAEQMREAGAAVVPGFREGLDAALESDGLDLIWVIGGSTLFDQALDVATLAEVTVLDVDAEGDTFAPVLDGSWQRTAVEPDTGWHESRTGVRYRFERWERP